jgi:hypothetical protein
LFSRIRTNTIIIQIKVLTCVLTSNARKTKQFRIRSKLIRFRVAVVSQCRPYLWPFVISRGCDVMSHLNRGDVTTIKMAPKSTCPVLTFANRLRFRNYRRNIANPSTDRIAQTDPVSRFLRDLYYRPKCQLCAYLKNENFRVPRLHLNNVLVLFWKKCAAKGYPDFSAANCVNDSEIARDAANPIFSQYTIFVVCGQGFGVTLQIYGLLVLEFYRLRNLLLLIESTLQN